ncbi:MAG: L-fucose/L-arabinose isomerase family protein [Eubacteriales bacterium]
MKKQTFALYFGNRGFFPESLIGSARDEMKKAVEAQGYNTLLADVSLTRFGAVETVEDGLSYAKFLEENRGKYDGVILCLPNFGDENGAIAALRDCGVPILIQAYPDEVGKMDFASRRDAFCGKFSIMDVFCQYGLPFTVFEPHTVHPLSDVFAAQLRDFAAVCRVVSGMKRFSVGALGARTTAFKTVRFDELTLQKYGITVEALDFSEVMLRLNKLDKSDPRIASREERLRDYTNFSCCPASKLTLLAQVSVVIDDIIAHYRLDSIALRCWEEIEQLLGVSPCVLLSELNDRGMSAACEVDVLNAVPMRALTLASEMPSMCLDWNNNYEDDPDKCILFHCGSIAQSYMTAKGDVIDHKMFAKSYGAGCGWGTNVGRIRPFDFTFASSKTENGKLIFYTGVGEFTSDPIEDGFFGCGGVARIDSLQHKLLSIGKNGYRHHVSVTQGSVERAVREAFETYLKYDLIEI